MYTLHVQLYELLLSVPLYMAKQHIQDHAQVGPVLVQMYCSLLSSLVFGENAFAIEKKWSNYSMVVKRVKIKV